MGGAAARWPPLASPPLRAVAGGFYQLAAEAETAAGAVDAPPRRAEADSGAAAVPSELADKLPDLLCDPCARRGCVRREERPREFKRCSACREVKYCGAQCQQSDWAAHKRVCRPCVAAPAPAPEAREKQKAHEKAAPADVPDDAAESQPGCESASQSGALLRESRSEEID